MDTKSSHIKLPLKPHWSLVDNNPNRSVRFTFDGFSAPKSRETHTGQSFLSSQAFLHNDAFSDLGREVRQVSADALMSLSAPRKPGVIFRGRNLKSAGLFISTLPDVICLIWHYEQTSFNKLLASWSFTSPSESHAVISRIYIYIKKIIRHTVSCQTAAVLRVFSRHGCSFGTKVTEEIHQLVTGSPQLLTGQWNLHTARMSVWFCLE